MSSKAPPFYILFAHSSLSPAPSKTFGHPVIQYHYSDDTPLILIPQQQEHVLLLEYQPDSTTPPAVRSISHAVAVTGIEVKDPVVASGVDGRNEKMYIIETSSTDDHERRQHESELSATSPRDIISEFRRKNAVLRRALHYPDTPIPSQLPSANTVSTLTTLSPTSPSPLSPPS